MDTRRVLIGGVILFALLGGLSTGRSRAGSKDEQRFNDEYPKALQELEKTYRPIKGTCRLLDSNWSPRDGTQPGPDSYMSAKFELDHGIEKVTITKTLDPREPEMSLTKVHCIGPSSGFGLRLEPGSSTYVVTGVGAGELDRSLYNMAFGRFANAPFAVFGRPLSEILNDPTYRLLSAEQQEFVGGSALFKVSCQTGESEKIARYDVFFDPSANWIIRSSVWQPPGTPPTTIRTDVEYGPAVDGLPPLPHLIKSNGWTVCEFDTIVRSGTPESEFRMSHYGLPEIGAASNGSMWGRPTTWMVAASLLCLTVAIALRFVAKRMSARTQ